MSDNTLDFSMGDDGRAREGIPPSRFDARRAPPTDSIPKVVAVLSNSWLWIGIGLVSLWLISNGG